MSEILAKKVTAICFEFVDEGNHFVVCTSHGFRLHESISCKLKVSTDNIPGGLRFCQPYMNSNIFFIVGSGQNQDYPSNKLCLWDDIKQMVVADI